MAERIYTRTERGKLEPLEEERFSTEDELQVLIAEHPELLDGEQIRPGDPRRWILITREKGIAETSDAAARWAIDLLIIDQDAVPTLAEVKRGSNPEIRRTIVGQMLEYAAYAAQTWTADELRRTFEESTNAKGLDPGDELATLLGEDGEPDADSFWQNVSTNLVARRLRLLFVADDIPDPLERVVEFLNGQMSGIEVLAVEIKQFRGKSTQTLVPRVIGRTAGLSHVRSAPGASPALLTRELFLDRFASDDKARGVADRLFDVARKSEGILQWGPSGVSVRMHCSVWQQPISVAWLYPPSKSKKGWMKTKNFSFGAAIFYEDPLPGEELRSVLERWIDQFSSDDFTEDVSSKGVKAWAVGYDAAARHADLLVERLAKVLSELRSL